MLDALKLGFHGAGALLESADPRANGPVRGPGVVYGNQEP
jgi:hypothetical protein